MKELRIKKFTVEEFKNKFNLDNIENISAYEVSELGNLFENSSEDVYFLIEDKLYAEPKKAIGEGELSREEIETIEKLNEEFRDSLISLREFLYHGNCNFLKMLGAKAPTMMPTDCFVLCTPTGIMILKMPGFKRNPGK